LTAFPILQFGASRFREAMADNAIRSELDDLYDKEAAPVFAGIGMGREADAYRDTIIERFSNPFLDHRLAGIHYNHDAKKRRRFGGLIGLAEANDVRVEQPRPKAALGSGRQDRPSHTG
jgi:tagaturonate reductase